MVHVIAFTYQQQLAGVCWGSTTSSTFGIQNGTRQGSVASPTFWSVYLDPLFGRLREAGFGCHIGGIFTGVIGYADALILLAPSCHAAQKMLTICERFAEEHNIQFSTDEVPDKSKSKAIHVVGCRGAQPKPEPLWLCGKPLPWVKRGDHLGHTIHEDGTMGQDCVAKRARFIDETCKIRETFKFAHPQEKLAAIEKYCTSMYGSNLWDLRSHESQMVFNSWKTSVKLTWNVHRGCRTFLLQKVLAPHHVLLRVNLLT